MLYRTVVFMALLCSPALAWQTDDAAAQERRPGVSSAQLASFRRPFKAFHMIANINYVGTEGVAIYLITTPDGHILLDTGMDETLRFTCEGIEKLGYKIEDIKIILCSHAHWDHVDAHAAMQAKTGAKVMVMKGDAETVSAGRKPTKVDRVLADGDTVSLGGATLTAHLTPGHTKGDTTWTMPIQEDGKTLQVVFFGSTTLPAKLVDNKEYPRVADDFRATFAKLQKMPCDVFLAPHGNFYGMEAKVRRLDAGEKPNPFIDSAAFGKYLEQSEKSFLAQVTREQAAAKETK